jgi:thiosulfate/3-mercaptopyruvate sulfurtransferase
MEGYARPELLAEPDWLWDHRDDPNVRLIDCDSLEAYRRAHIPGAVALPTHPWLKEGSELMKAPPGPYLTGSHLSWIPTGLHVMGPRRFIPRANGALMCRLDDLMARIEDPEVQVINVLPRGMYLGTDNPFNNKQAGHIPGSVNVPIEEFITDDDRQVFKPAPELRSLLSEAGTSPKKETVVHCQAGIRTTMGVFVLSLLGWERVRAYDASMAEWANRDDTPLVTE